MKKICVIMGGVMPVPAACGGAVETLITSLAKHYSSEDGFQLTICSVYHPEAEKAARQYPNVRFFWTHTRDVRFLFLHALFLGIRMTTGKCIRPLQRHYNEIAKLFQEERFDLIIAEGGDFQAIVDIAKGYRREQLVNHLHFHYLPSQSIAAHYGYVIGVSEYITNEYRKVCHMPVQSHTLKNAIDVELFSRTVSEAQKSSIRKKLGISEEDFVVLFAGRIQGEKGVLELMQAVLSIKDKHTKLLIIGGANSGKRTFSLYERKVKKLAGQNRDRILFTGYVDNAQVYQYASVANVQCVPTLCEEAAGLVVLEAMAEGLPLIVTRSGGIPEYVGGDAALFVERDGIVNNLQQAILYLKEHPALRKQMAQAAQTQSRQYDESAYYRNFVRLMHTILDANRENRNET